MAFGIRVNEFSSEDAKRDYVKFWAEMYPAVTKAVESSFLDANMRNPTSNEVRRRASMAKSLVEEMRHDLKWSRPRIKDLLLTVLKSRLSGVKLDLEAMGRRTLWTPDSA